MKADFLIENLKSHDVGVEIVTENVPVAEVGFCWSEKQSIKLDFSEHDKKVTAEKDAEIAELKTRNEKLEKENSELREKLNLIRQRCTTDAIEYWNDGHIGSLVVTIPKYLTSDKRFAELEDRHQSDCIRINQLLTTIDVLTERYQKLREVHGIG